MATSLSQCAVILARERIRHHVDVEEDAIRLVFVTRQYHNLRGERLLVATLETPDDGRRCRVAVRRAFSVAGDAAATCLAMCRLAADTPLVSVEFDADCEDLRMVVETVVEDGELTAGQLLSMIDGLIEAAECWASSIDGLRTAARWRWAA
jgi:hypothetical protein